MYMYNYTIIYYTCTVYMYASIMCTVHVPGQTIVSVVSHSLQPIYSGSLLPSS